MEPDAYADSSFLVSLHRDDAHHESATAFLAKSLLFLAFTPLHRIEVRNALRHATASGAMPAAACRLAFRQLDEDLRDGLLIHAAVEWPAVFRRADALSEKHAAKDGVRTLDLLHVALAIESGAKTFLSFDQRQRKLAKAAGLKVKP